MAVGMGPSRGINGGGYSNYNYKTVPGQNSVGNWNTGGSNYGYGNQNGITRYGQPEGLAGLPKPAGMEAPKPMKPMKPMQPPVMVQPPIQPPVQPPAPPPNVPGSPGWEWRQNYQPFTSGVRPGLNWNNNAGQWPSASNPQQYSAASQGGGRAGFGSNGPRGYGNWNGGRGW